MAGCGGKQPAASPAGPAAQGTAAQGPLKIAVIPKGLSHQFWLTVKAGAEAAGKDLGAAILWQGPAKETELDKQINIVQDMINRKVDGLVLAACDEHALIPSIQRALDAGIPTVTIDSGVQSELPLSFIATDNIAGARAAADVLAAAIGGSGKVGLIAFVPGAATSELRQKGFTEGITAHPGITLLPVQHCMSDVARAMNIAQDMMTANPDLKGIFAANEAAAIGAAQAVKAAGKTGQVKIVAFDASDDEIKDLKEGVLHALIVQNPFRMGYEGVASIFKARKGETLEKRVDTGVTVVTLENFDTPEVQKLLYPLQ
jgi:ribose transport system substrate-binding protein